MRKSVYSLVLTDDVVAHIDRLAYRNNTNRSNMVNQILAEYVSYVTPEKRIGRIFDQIHELLGTRDTFQMLAQPSDTMMSLRSALVYKYNPTVKYSVELYRHRDDAIGELRVTLRTQNSVLLLYMSRFFQLFSEIERPLIGDSESAFEDGRYTRTLVVREKDGACTAEDATIGELIADYIAVVDRSMKVFFSAPDDPEESVPAIRDIYRSYLAKHHIFL